MTEEEIKRAFILMQLALEEMHEALYVLHERDADQSKRLRALEKFEAEIRQQQKVKGCNPW